ncbi:MAG: ROK family protein [Planctomycetia bacterium]|nr:ROK family protein [Planctomycetia bacterium]
MPFLGIEIGGTKLQSAVVDAAGTILLARTDTVKAADGAEAVRRALGGQLDALKAALPRGMEIEAAGIGFGGPVDRGRGVVAASFHVDGWQDFPLADWISRRLGGLPVALENDANAAALAEACVGAGRGASPVLYSNAGSGIGGGLVIDGRLYHGRTPGEMEIGHLAMQTDGTILEDLASGWSIDRRVRARVAADPDGPLARIAAVRTAGARDLPAAISAGDAAARSILDEAARHYAWGLSHAVHLLNPEVIVLGGGVALIGEAWRDGVARHLESFLMKPLRPGPPVRLSALGQSVVPVGAAFVGADAVQ